MKDFELIVPQWFTHTSSAAKAAEHLTFMIDNANAPVEGRIVVKDRS